MPVWGLPEDVCIFPHPLTADASGILAIGGDLNPEMLIQAYRFGIFPWFGPGEPLMWWFPDPRMILYPEDVKVFRSMRPYFNQHKFRVTLDHAFSEVIRQCASTRRKNQDGSTWILDDMITAYSALHVAGYAHSLEVWQGDDLIGGLYGVAMGKIFFGESMFSHVSNSSKFGLICLCRFLSSRGFGVIDCQQETPHLATMGAHSVSASMFYTMIRDNLAEPGTPGTWQHAWDDDLINGMAW